MALTDPLQGVVILTFFMVVAVVAVYFFRTMSKAAKGSTASTPATESPAGSPVDYTSEGLTGVVYFAIGGTLLLYAFFWITSDLGNNDPIGGLMEYGLAFFALLVTAAGLHGILRSATH